MVSLIHFSLVLFIITGSSIGSSNGLLERYVPLISDVHKYYGTSSVFFISSSKNKHIQEYTLVHVLSREFSQKGVLTLIINFDKLEERTCMYRKRTVRPLIVVMLTTVDSIAEFIESTRGLNMSHPIWLLIFADEFGEPVCKYCNKPTINIFNVRFDTEMLVVCCKDPLLKEWWAVGENNKTEMAVFGRWTQNDGFELLAKEGLYSRRHEISGTGFRVAIVRNSAFLQYYGDGKFGGFIGNIVMELQRVMNFEITAVIEDDGYGNWNPATKSWSGAISHVANGDADLGLAEFTITNSRRDVVDFTFPLILTRARLYIKEPAGLGVQWSAYFKAFGYEIWTAIIVLMVTTPILLTLIKMKAGSNSLAYLFFENHLYVWGIFCQQGLAEFPAETPLRIAYFSIFVSALVVSAAYSASLISFLTVSIANLPFTTLEGFANDGSYKLVVMKNSSDYDFFVTSPDPVLAKMRTLLRPWKYLPANLLEGFQQVCTEKVGFYSNDEMVNMIDLHIPCKIISIESGRIESFAMILSAGSQFTNFVNYHIHRFLDNGMMNRLRQKHLKKPVLAKSTYNVVSLWGVAPLLSVLAGGVIVAFIVLFFEKLYKSIRNSGRNRRRVRSRRTKMHRWFNPRGNQRTSQSNSHLSLGWRTDHFRNSLIARYYP